MRRSLRSLLLSSTSEWALGAHARYRAFLGSMVVAANLAASRAMGGGAPPGEVEALGRAVELATEAECWDALRGLCPVPLAVYGGSPDVRRLLARRAA